MDIEAGCLVCDLLAGRKPLPGGIIVQTEHWAVDHCIAPLPVGTLVVAPRRHVTTLGDLTDPEAAEYGPLLREVCRVVQRLTGADQVYHCQWSHTGWQPGHIHTVVQPAFNHQSRWWNKPGPYLQVALLERDELPSSAEVHRFAESAREILLARQEQRVSA